MTLPLGLLVAAFDYSTIAEEEFNAWYDTEHIPERMAVKGFINAQRWIGADNQQFALATYDLENVRVLEDPAYYVRKAEGKSPWSRRISSKTKLLVRLVGEGQRSACSSVCALTRHGLGRSRGGLTPSQRAGHIDPRGHETEDEDSVHASQDSMGRNGPSFSRFISSAFKGTLSGYGSSKSSRDDSHP